MKKPMRLYRRPELYCGECGRLIRPSALGGWEHVRRVRITDPAFHVPHP